MITGCSLVRSAPKQVQFADQEKAATVQVAVQSVAPFEDYLSSLEPSFVVTTDQALNAAIAQTRSQDTQVVREFLATITAAKQAGTGKSGGTTGSSGGSGSGSGSSESQASASAPAATCPNVTVVCTGAAPASASTSASGGSSGSSGGGSGGSSGASAPSAPPAIATNLGALALPSATVDVDPALKLRAAAAYLQEAALLNHYVRDAAVRTGTKPYIVRMLISVLPSARTEPNDIYSTISFFTDTNPRIKPLRSFYYRTYMNSAVESLNRDDIQRKAVVANLEELVKRQGCTGEPVSVIPLLVTDDIESSLHSNTADTIRDLALAVQAAVNGAGVNAGGRIHAEDLEKTLNRNLNSIYTVGQAAPNVIQARLGAAFSNGQFVTVTRTYSLSLLLLVPTGERFNEDSPIAREIIPCSSLKFVAHTRMRDARSGELLRAGDGWAARELTKQLLAASELHARSFSDAEMLLDDARNDSYDAFKSHFRGMAGASSTADAVLQRVYTRAVAVVQANGESSGKFAISLNEAAMPDIRQHFSLLDDGKILRLNLGGGQDLLRDRLEATVKVQLPAPERWAIIKADSVDVSPDGRTARFTFPSLASVSDKGNPTTYAEVHYARGLRAWQTSYNASWYTTEYPTPRAVVTEADEAACCVRLSRFLGQIVANRVCSARAEGFIEKDELPISYVKQPEKKPTPPLFTLALPSQHIMAADDGTGELMIEIRSKDPTKPVSVHFTVSQGGFIDSVAPATLMSGADHVAPDGAYTLKLKSLIAKNPVTVSAFVLDGANQSSMTTAQADVVSKEKPAAKPASTSEEKPK